MLEISDALIVYVCDTESISGINRFRKYRLMPMSLLLGASETDVVSSCRDVRGVVACHLSSLLSRARYAERCDAGCITVGYRSRNV